MNADPVSAAEVTEVSGAYPRVEGLARSRDEQFEAFVTDIGPYLVRVALLLSGDRNHAEDLVQTTFERTYRAWERARATDPAPMPAGFW